MEYKRSFDWLLFRTAGIDARKHSAYDEWF